MSRQKEKTMEKALTPFEHATEFVYTLAEGLCSSYAMLNYIPALEDLERQSVAASMRGDAQLVANLAHIQSTLKREMSNMAFEA